MPRSPKVCKTRRIDPACPRDATAVVVQCSGVPQTARGLHRPDRRAAPDASDPADRFCRTRKFWDCRRLREARSRDCAIPRLQGARRGTSNMVRSARHIRLTTCPAPEIGSQRGCRPGASCAPGSGLIFSRPHGRRGDRRRADRGTMGSWCPQLCQGLRPRPRLVRRPIACARSGHPCHGRMDGCRARGEATAHPTIRDCPAAGR